MEQIFIPRRAVLNGIVIIKRFLAKTTLKSILCGIMPITLISTILDSIFASNSSLILIYFFLILYKLLIHFFFFSLSISFLFILYI